MKKTFYATSDLAFTALLIFGLSGLAFLFVSWDAGTLMKARWLFIAYFSFLVFFWFAITRGTRIIIDHEKIRGTVIFIPGKTVYLSDITAIRKRGIFGGIMTELYTLSRKKDGTLEERGLTTKEMLKKDDLIEFIETIHNANPTIDIPKHLVSK